MDLVGTKGVPVGEKILTLQPDDDPNPSQGPYKGFDKNSKISKILKCHCTACKQQFLGFRWGGRGGHSPGYMCLAASKCVPVGPRVLIFQTMTQTHPRADTRCPEKVKTSKMPKCHCAACKKSSFQGFRGPQPWHTGLVATKRVPMIGGGWGLESQTAVSPPLPRAVSG